VFRLGRTRLRDVMVSRERVVAIDRGIDSDALLDLIKESGFTRIPVYDGSFDNMIGILHTKDLFQVYADRRVVILEDAIRDAIFFRPTCRSSTRCAGSGAATVTSRSCATRVGP